MQKERKGAEVNGLNEALASPALKRFREIGEELRLYLYEREAAIQVVMIAFLIRHNVIFVSWPGTAKSNLLDLLCRSIVGARYFKIQLYKTTPPEFVFGPLDLKLLRDESVQRHKTRGYLPETNFALVDEFFSSNSGVLIGLNSMAHPGEREFSNGEGEEPMKCPIHSITAGTNYVPDISNDSDDLDLNKVYDRFLFRMSLASIVDDENFQKLLVTTPPQQLTTSLSFEELQELQKFVAQVEVSQEIVGLVTKLRRSLGWNESRISDRRWKWTMEALRGSAYLAGRAEVLPEDLLILQFVLWIHPDEHPRILSVILEVVFPNLFKALKESRVAEGILETARSSSTSTEKRGEQPIEIEKTRQRVVDLARNQETRSGYESKQIEKILGRVLWIEDEVKRLCLMVEP